MVEFSIVCPVKDQVELIPKTLPSFYAVDPSEVVLCFDNPPHEKAHKIAKKIADKHTNIPTKFVFVDRNPEYSFHQAWVRRKGFMEAKGDRILTTDIDLVININVLKAIKLVGKKNVGLVSLSKLWYPRGPMDYWRVGILKFLRMLHGMLDCVMTVTTFSGLYALWKPYWLDSEPEEKIQRLVNPKQFYRGEKPSLKEASAIIGEDTFLRDHVCQRHRCVYLRDVGAVDLGTATENLSYIQYMKGRYFALQGRSPLVSIGRAILRGQPHYLKGYLSAR